MGIEENINYQEEIQKRDQRITELEKENQELEKENQELKTELEKFQKPKKDSSNSSIPSSQNRYHKPYPEKEKSKLKTGGQPGHKGTNKKLAEHPDKIIELKPEKCLHCGNNHLIKTDKIEKRQLLEIPPMKAFITEYQKIDCQCPHCEKLSSVDFPENIKAPLQYGENTIALIGYLKVQNNLSHKKIANTLTDICGVELSEGTVDNALSKLAEKHKTNYENITEQVKKSEVVCSDETGARVNGKNKYEWFFGNEDWSMFKIHDSRAYAVIENIFGESIPVCWVSDRYSGQLKIESEHQVCLAHIIRNLKYVIKAEKSKWAKNLLKALQQVIHEIKTLGFDDIDREGWINKIKGFFTKRLINGKETKTLFKSLSKIVDSMVLFLKNQNVPWTNNLAERALRSLVVHLKVTGGFRSKEGAERYNILNSVIESAKKQGLDILSILSGKLKFNFSSA